MSVVRKMMLGAAGVALLASSIAPAYAGPRWGGGWGGGWGHRRDRDRVDAGDVLAGILIIGTIAAIASGSGEKKRRREEERRRERDEEWQRNRDTPNGESNNSESSNGDYQRGPSQITSEDDAVNACASAVEDRAGRAASVRDISDVQQQRDGWEVRGVVERRSGWRDRSADQSRFTCVVQAGRVTAIDFDGRSAV
jgi:hypothetical protein